MVGTIEEISQSKLKVRLDAKVGEEAKTVSFAPKLYPFFEGLLHLENEIIVISFSKCNSPGRHILAQEIYFKGGLEFLLRHLFLLNLKGDYLCRYLRYILAYFVC